MPNFKKRPVVVEAIRLTQNMSIETPKGLVDAEPGDWLITGVEDEQYPIKHSIFMLCYEPVDEAAAAYLQRVIMREKNASEER